MKNNILLICGLLIIGLVPFSYVTVLPSAGIQLHDVVTVAAFFALLLVTMARGRVFVLNAGYPLMAIFVLFTIVVAFDVGSGSFVGDRTVPLMSRLVLFWFCLYISYVYPFTVWSKLIAVCVTATAILAIMQYLGYVPIFNHAVVSGGSGPRILATIGIGRAVTGLIPIRGSYGIWLISGMCAIFTLLFRGHRNPIRWFVLSLMALAIIGGGVISQSRSTYISIVCFLVGMFFLFVVNQKDKAATHRRVLLLIPAAGLVLLEPFLKAFEWLETLNVKSVDARLGQYSDALNVFLASPLVGNGSYLTDGQFPIHNIYLYLLGSYGLIPFCIFAFVMGYAIWAAWKLFYDGSDRSVRKVGGLWLVTLLASNVILMLYLGFYSKVVWMLIGLAYGDILKTKSINAVMDGSLVTRAVQVCHR